jgi:glycosyltransferase involved in cell wall biosynthesis
MKILHIKNTAGVATQLRNAQRDLGHTSDILCLTEGGEFTSDYSFPGRFESFSSTIPGKAAQLLENILYFNYFIDSYDVLHFHSYTIIGANVAPRKLPQGLDIPLWKSYGKKVVKHHHGSDIRYRGVPYFQKRYADKRLVSTPDLLKWDDGAELLLNPIVTDNYEYVGVEEVDSSEPITVVHAPTDREKKGTSEVIAAVNELQREGVDVELTIVENTPNDEAIEIYKEADIIADRFKLGWYGVFAIEAMTLGKPVLVYMKDEYKKYVPDAPVVDTDITEIKEYIRMLVEDYEMRKKLGEEGRRFVEKQHDAEAVARRVLDIYRNC